MQPDLNDHQAPAPGNPSGNRARRLFVGGWVVAIAGMVLWTLALFVDGGPPIVDWVGIAPGWIAELLPNKLAELGLVMSLAGMGPIYYVQIQQLRGRA